MGNGLEQVEVKELDWDKYTGSGEGGRFFKPELGRKYRLRFVSIREGSVPEKSNGVLTGKSLPALHLEISSVDGVKQEPTLPWDSSAKTLARGLMPYYKQGVLFDYDFDVAKVQLGGKQYPEFSVAPVLVPKVGGA
jgi:hypothetical protein